MRLFHKSLKVSRSHIKRINKQQNCHIRMVASENLWSVDFRPGSTHNDVLFIKLSKIWSGVNTKGFILKINGMF